MVDNFYTACVFPCLTCLVNLTQKRQVDIDSSCSAVHHVVRSIMSCGPSCRAVHHVVRSITSCGPSRRAVHHVVRAVTWWGHHVVRSSRAANASAARRQVCVECADRVSRKEAKAQRARGIGTDITCGGACCGALRCSAVLPGREHERSEASGARGMRGQSLTQRRKGAKSWRDRY